ncbi:MAG: hypothetical protein IKR92_06005 [Alphaproteobacteria bacterium]|nr:hypothetical protein [Alphaproteobacteria bacterium]
MNKLEVMFLVAVVEVGELNEFTLEELSEFWSALTVCYNDNEFFASLDSEEQKAVTDAVKRLETELRRRHLEPVNFFQLMQENPARVEFYLSKFSLSKLLDLEADLQTFEKSQIIADFLKLVKKQIYRRIPVS